jgi:hypothetical protein
MEEGSRAMRAGSRGMAFYLLCICSPDGLNFVLRVGETFVSCI